MMDMSNDSFQIVDAPIWDIKTNWSTRNWLKQNVTIESSTGINLKGWKPLLVRTNIDTFFDVLKAEAEKGVDSKICNEANKKAVISNIEKTKKAIEKSDAFNFLKNSSIWLRLCDNEDWDDKDATSPKPIQIERALEEFKWFEELRLYEFNAAKEYMEYNVRAQSNNYLDDLGGHGVHVTPMLYSDEVECRDFFIYNDNTKNNSFEILGKENDPNGFHSDNIPIRILVVDDKIGSDRQKDDDICDFGVLCSEKCEGKGCKVYKEGKNKEEGRCKLDILRKLLSGDFIKDKGKQGKFKERTYWANNIKAFCFNKVCFSDVWEPDTNDFSQLKIKEGWIKHFIEGKEIVFDNFIKYEPGSVQVIGVRDLESALVLMSCWRFDIILLDYLLGDRTDGQDGRTYNTELFEFLNYDFKERDTKQTPDIVKMIQVGGNQHQGGIPIETLKEFRDRVRLNRGPLDKYWFVPMTSYNPSFLADLQRRNVRLIDFRWNISQGADPINTPWRFLYKLNEFLELQVHQCVFWRKQLLTFLQYTCEDFEEQIKGESEGSCFSSFQSFMGAEYANFMKRYGARKLIERDAASKGDNTNKSLFATYINTNFYNNSDYTIENELNRLMQSFYHKAATMFNDSECRKNLRNAFDQLRLFIESNHLEKNTADEENLHKWLSFLHVVIYSNFEYKRINDWINK